MKKKFNIVDLLIIIIVIAVLFGAYKIFKKTNSGPLVPDELVAVTFIAENAPDFSVQSVKVGDKVADESLNVQFGTIKEEPIIGENLRPEVTANGVHIVAPMPGYKSIQLTAVGRGRITDFGVKVGSQLYGKGHSMVIRAGHSKIYVKVMDIQKYSGE